MRRTRISTSTASTGASTSGSRRSTGASSRAGSTTTTACSTRAPTGAIRRGERPGGRIFALVLHEEFEVGAATRPTTTPIQPTFRCCASWSRRSPRCRAGSTRIGAFFDYDELLSEWAVSGIIAHWDAYDFSIINNYRVYHDPSADRWSIIPTGIDQTFAGDPWSGTDLDPFLVAAVLATRCLEEADCAAAFAARLAQVADVFEEMDLAAEAERIHALILPNVAADPRREFDLPTWDWLHQQLLAWIAGARGSCAASWRPRLLMRRLAPRCSPRVRAPNEARRTTAARLECDLFRWRSARAGRTATPTRRRGARSREGDRPLRGFRLRRLPDRRGAQREHYVQSSSGADEVDDSGLTLPRRSGASCACARRCGVTARSTRCRRTRRTSCA